MTAEERYDLECQIDALYDEAEYCDDHNNPRRAIAARYEADQLRKKLEADNTSECLSEACEDCDPFDVDWNDKKDNKYVERRKHSKGVDEDYTGNPEERTDHLDYVDDNPTDDKFKFPKNITKKDDDHCEKVNPVINHDPDDKNILKEDINFNDPGWAPMWCCGKWKELYEFIKEYEGSNVAYEKDPKFVKLCRAAIKETRKKYNMSVDDAANAVLKGYALYKHLYESLVEKSDNPLKEAYQPLVVNGFVVDFCDGEFNWDEYFGESYAYIDVYPQKPGIGTDTTVTFIFSGPHGDWYDYDFSAHDYGYQFGQHVVDLEVSYLTPEYKNDELVRKVAKYSDYPENNIISDSDAIAILGVDQATYDQLVVKAAEEAAKWFNEKAEEYVDDHASDLFDWDRW